MHEEISSNGSGGDRSTSGSSGSFEIYLMISTRIWSIILILGGPLVISRGSNDDIANTAVIYGIVSSWYT